MDELDCGWQIIEGKKPVLVVAGHNLQQGRLGGMKPADMGTGEMARRVCDQYGFWGIVSTRRQMDPNWYVDSPFRNKVREIVGELKIRLIIDIHGSKLGSTNLLGLKGNDKFRENYLLDVEGFRDDDQETLAEEMNETVAVLQVEIREDGRVATVDESKLLETKGLIDDLITKLNENQNNFLEFGGDESGDKKGVVGICEKRWSRYLLFSGGKSNA